MQYKCNFAHYSATRNIHHHSPIGPDGSNFIFSQSDSVKLIFLKEKKTLIPQRRTKWDNLGNINDD